jgi:putative DNA primase/helicase
VTASESEAGKKLAESLIKSCTGTDKIAARYLYSESFEFHPTFKLWFATNNKPRIIGTEEAIWRRIRLVPFTVTIPSDQRDKQLGQKLKTEASGIWKRILAGLRDWQANGLQEPDAVNRATYDYRASQDVLAHFLDAKCTIGSDLRAPAGELYRIYSGWTEENGEYHMTERDFKAALEARGPFEWKRTSSGRFWSGPAPNGLRRP